MGQNDREPPRFFPFEDRRKHDLDGMAEQVIERDLGPMAEERLLRAAFDNPEFFWKALYMTFDQFRTQFGFCRNRAIDVKFGRTPPVVRLPDETELPPASEPSSEAKAEIFERDGNRCVCCGSTRVLEVDHVKSRYRGGGNEPGNLQLLCKVCNGLKGTLEISILRQASVLGSPPAKLPGFEMRDLLDGGDLGAGRERALRRWINFFYQCSAVEAIEAAHKDGKLRTTKIKLRPGLDRSWIGQHIERAIRIINSEPAHGEVPSLVAVTLTNDHLELADERKTGRAGQNNGLSGVGEADSSDSESAEEETGDDSTTIGEVLETIFDVEGFRVRVVNRQGRRINGSWARGIEPYPYRNKLNEAKTVNTRKTTRFLPVYQAFDNRDYFVDVLDRDGEPCAGNTKLRTVRESYF